MSATSIAWTEYSVNPIRARLRDAARTVLAWNSIVVDINNGTLNVDLNQKRQAEQEARTAEGVLPRTAREAYCWLLVPHQEVATAPKPAVEAFKIPTSGSSAGTEIERVCVDNELVIETWGAFHLATLLQEFYWRPDEPFVRAMAVWDDMQKYLYMPRLKGRDVIAKTTRLGAATADFFGVAYGRTADGYTAFSLGEGNVQFDDTLLLIEPAVARAYRDAKAAPAPSPPVIGEPGPTFGPGTTEPTRFLPTPAGSPVTPLPPAPPKARVFYGTAEVPAATAKMRLMQLADEIIANLVADPNGQVTVTLEITAKFDGGAQDSTRRTVSENATALKLKAAEWE